MAWLNLYTLCILALVLAAQFFYRFSSGRLAAFFIKFKFHTFLRWIWILSGVLIFSLLTYWSYLQYELWSGEGGFGKFLLPPYQSIYYFFSYVGVRFFGPWILAFFAAILVSRLAKFLNRRFEERFFEPEEIELIALGTFLAGYPGFFFYLALILTVGVLFSAFYLLLSKGRLPLYYFWIPLAIFAIIMKIWFLGYLGNGFVSFWGSFSLGDFYKLIFGF
ncbi:MAG: hypothetical protein HY093_03510 [Candidatus Liptonbacteria bacterium]|nr:hypothetical protein [Candidatus Liptonbacteria bacterium]